MMKRILRSIVLLGTIVAPLFAVSAVGQDLPTARDPAAPVDFPLLKIDGAPGIEPGKLLYFSQPQMPQSAREQKINGDVTVAINIDETGHVTSAHAIDGPAVLADVSEKAAGQCLFSPTRKGGVPVPTKGTIVFGFWSWERTLGTVWHDVGKELYDVWYDRAVPIDLKSDEKAIEAWIGKSDAKEFFTLAKDPHTRVDKTQLQILFTSIRDQLQSAHPVALWYFDLGVMRSKLEASVLSDATIEQFKGNLAAFRTAIANAPAQIAKPRLADLSFLALNANRPLRAVADRTLLMRVMDTAYRKLYLAVANEWY